MITNRFETPLKLSWVALGSISFAQEVGFSLAVGEISEPFETPEGFHLLLRVS